MQISALSSLFLAAFVVAKACNEDNCLRALQGPDFPGRLQSAQSFCATFTVTSVPASAIPSFAANACVQNQNAPLSSRISSACSCIAVSTSSAPAMTTPTASATSPGACALVSSSSAAQKAISPAATPTVAAQLAHDCLNSVPLNKTLAIEFANSLQPYLEWQSDSAFKKDPPADYFYPPHDIFGYLDMIKANLANDVYANEYEFQEDLYQIFARGHDGHFILYPDLLTRAFEWGRKRSLVSISEDGTSLPVIKLYEDVISSPATAPVVVLINGIDAATFVGNRVYTASFNQDADAAYNTMFYEKAYLAASNFKGFFGGGGRIRYIYPGPNTTFAFSNGTTVTLDNIANVKGNFNGVVDGTSFFQKFCFSTTAQTADSIAAVGDIPSDLTPAGYPVPVESTSDAIVSGYYLDGAAYKDVAVLSLLAFESASPLEFQQICQKFIADAVRDGKTKLVIDLSANGGGYILQGYDLYRQLFPDIVQKDYTRWRESDTFLAISQLYSAASAGVNINSATQEQIQIYENTFNYRYDYNLTEDPFKSFSAKFSPRYFKGDPFTHIIRWNLDDTLTTSNKTYGLGTDITGYGSRKNFTQPFKAENIIMLYDGYCASTCTLFSEFMRLQGHVKSIAMGGRPKVGPIQGVGGIKGAEILNWANIYNYAQQALALNASSEQAAILNRLTLLPVIRSSASGINVRDNILPGNLVDGLPAQFVVEEADCRLYWTLPMITDVTAVWKAAADAAFNGAKCVYGSLKKREVETESPKEREKRALALERQVERAVRQERREVSMGEKSEMWKAKHLQKAIP